MQYAKDGHKFYSVITPSVAVEYELPEEVAEYSDDDERRWQALADTAEAHGTHVQACTYARLSADRKLTPLYG